MNKVAIIIISLILTMGAGLGGCFYITPKPAPVEPTPAPAQPAPGTAPAPTPAQPEAGIVVIECPTEARIGEYITVRIQLPSDTPVPKTLEQEDYLLRIRDEFPPSEQHTSVVAFVYNLGYAIPDENLVLCWYVSIPIETLYDLPFRPGNYKLEVTQEGSSTKPAPVHPSSPPGYQEGTRLHHGNLLERNIIIKE